MKRIVIVNVILGALLAGSGCESIGRGLDDMGREVANFFTGKATEELDRAFQPEEITSEQTEELVTEAWNNLNKQEGPGGYGDDQVIVVAKIRFSTSSEKDVDAPDNIHDDIASTLRGIVNSTSGYEYKSRDWLENNLRRTGARDVASILDEGRKEELRKYLETAGVDVRYLLLPKFIVTYYDRDRSWKYTCELERIDLDSESGHTTYGKASFKP